MRVQFTTARKNTHFHNSSALVCDLKHRRKSHKICNRFTSRGKNSWYVREMYVQIATTWVWLKDVLAPLTKQKADVFEMHQIVVNRILIRDYCGRMQNVMTSPSSEGPLIVLLIKECWNWYRGWLMIYHRREKSGLFYVLYLGNTVNYTKTFSANPKLKGQFKLDDIAIMQ